MDWLVIVLFSFYIILVLLFWIFWLFLPSISSKNPTHTSLSVIIIFRNEALNLPYLLQDLENQTLDKSLWEVLFVDDFSEDNSLSILENLLNHSNLKAKILKNDIGLNIISPKKRGITQAISLASGDLIVCTDADCRLQTSWLNEVASFYEQTQAYFISSPVKFNPLDSFFAKLQALEFASLIGSGAACIGLKAPTMCNGANVAYKKSVFLELEGFQGSEQVASGDDEFLMHKFAKKYPQSVQFNKSENVVVTTAPHSSWNFFMQQRKRWASKWENYQNLAPKVLAVFIFLANLLTVYLYIRAFFEPCSIIWLSIGLKFCVEFVFLAWVLKLFRQTWLLWWMPLLFVLYPFYVVLFALISRKKSYIWKDRKH